MLGQPATEAAQNQYYISEWQFFELVTHIMEENFLTELHRKY